MYNMFNVIKDFVTGNLRFANKEVINKRRLVCEECEVRNPSFDTCTVCDCYIPAKTALEKSSCPMEKW